MLFRSVPDRIPKTLPNSSWCTSERANSLKRASSHALRAASPHGGAAIEVTSSCKSSNSRVCERNQANASWTLRNSAARATCCCAERDPCDSLKDDVSVEDVRAGGPRPMVDAPYYQQTSYRSCSSSRWRGLVLPDGSRDQAVEWPVVQHVRKPLLGRQGSQSAGQAGR